MTIKYPGGPLLELNFYSHNFSEIEFFTHLLTALIQLGAQFFGQGCAYSGPNIRDKPFASINDMLCEPVEVKSLQDIEQYSDNPDLRLVKVYMHNIIDVEQTAAEVVTYVSLPAELVRIERHPVAIWTEGSILSGTFSTVSRQRQRYAQEVGNRVYEKFKALIELLQPAYAAITSEEDLKTPTGLQYDPRNRAFQDFYVSFDFLDSQAIERIKYLYKDAYIECMKNGIYISTYEYFNPIGVNFRCRGVLKEVGELIGATTLLDRSCSTRRGFPEVYE